ncbi:MAG: hypothetical protein SFY66_20015 [Oculatellaceae cyanobacterium bins.114]|nr:hypothetical protein [Oculatellaceae cyanobacterium bins.114]
MQAPSTADLLTYWERGLSESLVHRAVNLLVLACPEMTIEQAVGLSIGQRDQLLLILRERLFGSEMVSLTTCPVCGDCLELKFHISDVCSVTDIKIPPPLSMDGYDVQYRLPTSQDLLEITYSSAEVSENQIRHQLLEYCVLSALYQGQAIPANKLPESVVEAIATAMSQADPQADIQLALVCPACGHQWQALFDVVTFLWSEIHVWAKRVLQEVHRLALTYGWREADILAMSPQRRHLYLEMIGE